MTFDQVFPGSSTETATKCPSRFDSFPYDEQKADMPVLVPVSPCSSAETSVSGASTSITGKFTNIKHKYHVDPRVLGTGLNGSVRECIDRRTGQRFAVKSIGKRDSAVKPGGLAREIMLLREMRHRNIVQLVDVCEDENYVHLITDLCDGGELFDKIIEKSSDGDNEAPCFTEKEAARILHQILTAVSYMHDSGIVHRDIKPENILFETTEDDSQVKIIDFGLSRKHNGSRMGEPPMTTVVGTPYYIAPEVLKRRYSKACDLWSVGVIAYIMLCGYPPFNGGDNSATYDAVRQGHYRFPAAEWSYTSRESRDFVRRLLQKDPRKRMTAKQALRHPWIVKNINNIQMEEDRHDNSSVEVVFHGQSQRESIIVGPATRHKVEMPLLPDI